MKKVIIGALLAGPAVFGWFVSEANAALISGYGAPSSIQQLSGGFVTDFENIAAGTYGGTLSGNKVSFAANPGKNMYVGSWYTQQRNTTGAKSLYNLDNNTGFSTLYMNFDAPVSAFGFNFGASDIAWTLAAYNAAGKLLESYVLPVIGASNKGDFFGIANSAGIASARLIGSSGDWVLIDRVTVSNTTPIPPTAVPAPPALALLGGSLLGLSWLRRRAA